jgi:hypothetical protein
MLVKRAGGRKQRLAVVAPNSRHHLAAFSVRREDFLAVAAQVNGGVRRFRIVQHPNIGILAELVILLLPP